jgi:hypothetical protein
MRVRKSLSPECARTLTHPVHEHVRGLQSKACTGFRTSRLNSDCVCILGDWNYGFYCGGYVVLELWKRCQATVVIHYLFSWDAPYRLQIDVAKLTFAQDRAVCLVDIGLTRRLRNGCWLPLAWDTQCLEMSVLFSGSLALVVGIERDSSV